MEAVDIKRRKMHKRRVRVRLDVEIQLDASVSPLQQQMRQQEILKSIERAASMATHEQRDGEGALDVRMTGHAVTMRRV